MGTGLKMRRKEVELSGGVEFGGRWRVGPMEGGQDVGHACEDRQHRPERPRALVARGTRCVRGACRGVALDIERHLTHHVVH